MLWLGAEPPRRLRPATRLRVWAAMLSLLVLQAEAASPLNKPSLNLSADDSSHRHDRSIKSVSEAGRAALIAGVQDLDRKRLHVSWYEGLEQRRNLLQAESPWSSPPDVPSPPPPPVQQSPSPPPVASRPPPPKGKMPPPPPSVATVCKAMQVMSANGATCMTLAMSSSGRCKAAPSSAALAGLSSPSAACQGLLYGFHPTAQSGSTKCSASQCAYLNTYVGTGQKCTVGACIATSAKTQACIPQIVGLGNLGCVSAVQQYTSWGLKAKAVSNSGVTISPAQAALISALALTAETRAG